jgi:hypothetical protein
LVERIASQGEPGIAVVVEGLNSPKESLRREVRLGLDDELDRWLRLPRKEAGQRLGWLASALAAEAEWRDPSSRSFAADLAMRLLLWPADGGTIDRSRLVAQCEQVLRAVRPPGDGRWRREQELARASRASADRLNSPLPVTTHETLPSASLQAPALPPLFADDRTAESSAVAVPRTLEPEKSATRLAPADRVERPAMRNPLRASANEPARADEAPADEAGWAPAAGETEPKGSVETASALEEIEGLQRQNSLELFAQLKSGDAEAAEAELTRRGYTYRQIEVGKHLASKDPEERRRWTEALPGMRGINTKDWLLLLSRDENAEVRRAAVTLMATSQDPEMLARVEEVARIDPDSAIRQQAARTLSAGK